MRKGVLELCILSIIAKKDVYASDILGELKEAKLSKSKARAAIEAGALSGWEDPRTWSLQSLRRRGIQPEAIRNFIIGMGMSLADVNMPAEILYAENRKLTDKRANRCFAVFEPFKIAVAVGNKWKKKR